MSRDRVVCCVWWNLTTNLFPGSLNRKGDRIGGLIVKWIS